MTPRTVVQYLWYLNFHYQGHTDLAVMGKVVRIVLFSDATRVAHIAVHGIVTKLLQ